MIDAFGTLGDVLAAAPARLLIAARGDLAAVREIAFFRRTMATVLQSRIVEGPSLPNARALALYLRFPGAWLRAEQVRLLHFDRRRRLLRDEMLAEGTLDAVPICAREIVRRALDYGSAAVVLAHNHPSGDPTPSRQDKDVTRRVIAACALVQVEFYDHIIVASGGYASFRAMGLL